MKWSPQQNEALSKAAAWLRLRFSPFFYLAGYAGTGKTTLAMHLAQHEKGKVAFAAFTGKAARVMRSKGCEGAKTIHSLIYTTQVDPVTGVAVSFLNEGALTDVSLVIIDECSMVNEEMGKDLLSFGVPVLVLGDPAQLPPVSGAGFFTSGKPDYLLTEIHRQAAESPIVRLATEIRQNGSWRQETAGDELTIVPKGNLDPALVTEADTIIVGRNDTRQKYNARLRQLRGIRKPMPQIGEPLICLSNDRHKVVSNGEIYVVSGLGSRAPKGCVRLNLSDPEDSKRQPFGVKVRRELFTDESAFKALPFSDIRDTQQFTFGYVITGHKSQGSQWPNVCVFDESHVFREHRNRWLYTAVTRASEKLTLVI